MPYPRLTVSCFLLVLGSCADDGAKDDGAGSSGVGSATEGAGTTTTAGSTEGSGGDGGGSRTSTTDGDGDGGGSGSGATGSDGGGTSGGTGGGASDCPEDERFSCAEPIDCGDANCGHRDSWFDERGCLRPACGEGDACPDGLVCFAPASVGGCVGSGLWCDDEAGECLCGGTDDCGGRFCLPEDEVPVSCGGFAGQACPPGTTCVDIPDDGCDPTGGGADCPGVCE